MSRVELLRRSARVCRLLVYSTRSGCCCCCCCTAHYNSWLLYEMRTTLRIRHFSFCWLVGRSSIAVNLLRYVNIKSWRIRDIERERERERKRERVFRGWSTVTVRVTNGVFSNTTQFDNYVDRARRPISTSQWLFFFCLFGSIRDNSTKINLHLVQHTIGSCEWRQAHSQTYRRPNGLLDGRVRGEEMSNWVRNDLFELRAFLGDSVDVANFYCVITVQAAK